MNDEIAELFPNPFYNLPHNFLFRGENLQNEILPHNFLFKGENLQNEIVIEVENPAIQRRLAKRVKCPHCQKILLKKSLYSHLKLHELKKYEKMHKCEKCPRKFYTKGDLKQHETIHSKIFSCQLCGRRFSCAKLIQKHFVKKKCKICQQEVNCLHCH